MRVRKYQRPCLALLFSTRPCVPLGAARLFHLPLATSCPAQWGKVDVQSGLPADAASLRETGSVDRYTLRGPVSHRIVLLAAVQCLVSLILSLMAPRVCTLVLSRDLGILKIMYDSIRTKLGTFANYFTLPFGCIFSTSSLNNPKFYRQWALIRMLFTPSFTGSGH